MIGLLHSLLPDAEDVQAFTSNVWTVLAIACFSLVVLAILRAALRHNSASGGSAVSLLRSPVIAAFFGAVIVSAPVFFWAGVQYSKHTPIERDPVEEQIDEEGEYSETEEASIGSAYHPPPYTGLKIYEQPAPDQGEPTESLPPGGAHVEKTLPVRPGARKPFALWLSTSKDRIVLIDRSGSLIEGGDIEQFKNLPKLIGEGAPEAATEIIEASQSHPALRTHIVAFLRVSNRRWDLALSDDVMVKLPETDWRGQLAALESLIVKNSILERNVSEIDLRSPTHYFFLLRTHGVVKVTRK